MTTVLIRFAELGLKSERVRSRFLKRLADDIEESLFTAGVEHILEIRRSRLFVETDQDEKVSLVLRQVPGVSSFSFVVRSSSRKDLLMGSLSKYGETRIRKGMTYGLKVRRTGNHPYTSQEIAVEGGGAVVSHLKEGAAAVDLKHPDVWIEVEIRDSRAYIFDNRTKGPGGMPASSQGKVLLLLPEHDADIERRSMLSFILMRRRGCKVIPASMEEHSALWSEIIKDTSMGQGKGPFVLKGDDLLSGLIDAAELLKVRGIVIPSGPGKEGEFPVIHSQGAPISQFYPTASMDLTEVDEWLRRLIPPGLKP
ncbi:MAG: THUMP domain-containing protein [Thermoplasmatota archaeon]